MSEISRRNFLKGAAVAGAAVAGSAALAGCSSGGSAASGDWMPKSWDYETDVVVVGYGGAGMWSSLVAADEGGSEVVILEKAPVEGGGNSRINNGEWTVIKDEKLFRDYCVAFGHGLIEEDMIDAYIGEATKHTDYADKYGMTYEVAEKALAGTIPEYWFLDDGAYAGIIGVASFVAQIFESSIQAWTEDAVEGMIAGTALEGASPDAAASVVGGAFNTFAWEVALWAVLCVIALWAFSVVGSVVQYGGFRVRRRENRIEVEHGLLQRSFHGVDVDRVQTVVIKQSFVRRLIGYCELSVGKIDSLSTEDSNAQSSSVRGLVIHPFVKVSRVPEILDGVLPEFSHVPEETVRPAAVALRRAIVRRSVIRGVSFWLFVVAVAAYAGFVYTAASGMVVVDPGLFSIVQIAFFVYCGFFILMFALNVIDAVLWYKRSAMGCNRVFMSMTNGGLSVKTSIIPRKKIQYGFIRTNPFQRMAHVAIVNARPAAGVGGTTEALWDVSEEDAAAWIEWIRPRTESSVTER